MRIRRAFRYLCFEVKHTLSPINQNKQKFTTSCFLREKPCIEHTYEPEKSLKAMNPVLYLCCSDLMDSRPDSLCLSVLKKWDKEWVNEANDIVCKLRMFFLFMEAAIIYETQVISPSVEEGSFMKCGRCTKLIYPPDELINNCSLTSKLFDKNLCLQFPQSSQCTNPCHSYVWLLSGVGSEGYSVFCMFLTQPIMVIKGDPDFIQFPSPLPPNKMDSCSPLLR